MPDPVSLRLQPAPRYEEFYGFVHPPFAPVRDTGALYRIRSQRTAIDAITDAVHDRDPFIVLTGPAGTGKTTVCRALPEALGPATVAALVLEAPGTIEGLLRTVLLELGVISRQEAAGARVQAATHQELADTLQDFLRSLEPIDAACAIVIDDAQRLTPALLDQLDALLADGHDRSSASVVLCGEPALLDALAQIELRELNARVTVRSALGPLGRDEVDGYIAHRLSQAGAADPPRFDAGALDAVLEHTRGVPGEIDALCDRTLMLGAQLGIHAIGREVVEEAARGVGLAAAAPAGASWWLRPRTWIWGAIALLVLLALMAIWFSGPGAAPSP